VHPDKLEAAKAANPFYTRPLMGKSIMYYEQGPTPLLAALGEPHTPTVADLFVAKLSPGAA
jgi:ABC-2 type transport system ATP-binding protein